MTSTHEELNTHRTTVPYNAKTKNTPTGIDTDIGSPRARGIHRALLKVRLPRNVGLVDRIVRALIGMGLMVSFYATSSSTATGANDTLGALSLLILAGVYPFLTALLAYDPIYQSFGIRTAPKEPSQEAQLDQALRQEPDVFKAKPESSSEPKYKSAAQ